MTSTLPRSADAPQEYRFEHGYPDDATVARIRDDADLGRAVTAYRFWYPTVSAEGIFNGNREAGIEDGRTIGIAATGPKQVGFTLNSDTPYGSAVLDLTGGPMVVELPAGPYIGLVDDHHQRWVADLGIPGPDAGKGGKHVILPPGHSGEVPAGHHVGRAGTYRALLAVRALPLDGNLGRALDALRRVKVYPLGRPDRLLDFEDTSDRAMDSTCLRWEDDFEFWQVLHRVLDAEPLAEAYRDMYGLLTTLGIIKGRPFTPDQRMTSILSRAARIGRDQLLVSAFASARRDRIAWPDRRWEWVGLVPDDPDFQTPVGLDLEARDRWFAQAIVTSPAMFRRQVGGGSLYWLAARDATGAYLDGGTGYTLEVPQPVPANLFWSVTVYDAQTRSQVRTAQNRGALRSLVELRGATGADPVLLHFGPTPPAENADTHWIQTAPGRGWFAYLRIYGPEQAAFDGAWKPGDLTPA
ncbi:DUF1254 domain-containing protein [Catellatospora sp. KI3]|uniref:DUF1254 domain-containing protein n=1 Tax=Catellatospora sp. KI3 TaxID=3041620 RepID=UPI002482416D|nr:DUF1254 domain-containing protein [Catellatospora sp. KI3]MDI1462219.1 DUF1254 domain-containing protein [Catellatospora sp. KI3]